MEHLKFKHPFTAVVAGPTSCGKTSFVRVLLGHYLCATTIAKDNIRVMWCYGQWQNCYDDQVSDFVHLEYHEGVPSQDTLETMMPDIVILDDLMFEVAADNRVAKIFTMFSHHNDISVIFITQNLTCKGKGIIEINRNTMYTILFKNSRDGHAISTLSQQVLRDNKRHFREAFEDATKLPYGYLVVDCHPTTPREFLLKTNVTGNVDVYAEKKADIEKLKALFSPSGTSHGHYAAGAEEEAN